MNKESFDTTPPLYSIRVHPYSSVLSVVKKADVVCHLTGKKLI